MTPEEKLSLLSRNIWKKKEVNAYFDNIFTACDLKKIFRQLKLKTATPKCTVYRDEVLKLLNTSATKEIKLIKKIEIKEGGKTVE